MSNAFNAPGVPYSSSNSVSNQAVKDGRSPENWNYEATVTQIEQIITQIETGELELAEVFDRFAAAVEYLHQCETFLAQQQQQMDLLVETLIDEEF